MVLPTHRADHPDHIAARNWLDTMPTSREQFGVPWIVWWSLRLSSHWRVVPVPTPVDEAFNSIIAMRAQPGHISVEPKDNRAVHRGPGCS